ncbi:MAG: Hsp70 family protein [Lachnospiraceae bacterium]|nr:Hsp70 family protein [Lachnospiraceae bacterium]
MFDEGRKNSFNPDDFEEDEEFFFSDGNDYEETGENPEFLGEEEFSSEDSKNENSDEDTDKEDNEGHAFMSEDEQPKFGDYSFDDSTESGFEEKADQADNHESSENASSYSDDSEEDASAENRDDAEDEGREIGIDLGTTNSVIAYIDKNGATKFVKVKNESLIPSFIFFKDKDTVYYGKKAKSYAKAMSQGAAVSLFKKHLRTDSEKIKVMIPRTEIVGQDGKKYYVIDTNVFIDQPGILELFDEDDVILLPITVEQELEYRATDINTKYSAEKALEEIIGHRDRLVFAESDESLLSEDFFKNFSENFNNANNDNKILSIALKYKEQNPILISSDNRLAKIKASFMGIKGLSLQEFSLEKCSESKFDEIELTGTQATTMFLTYLKQEAEKALKQPVSKAVITVPATFNIVEIENTKKAGLDAGFEEIHIEKEPTAAAIAYNIDANDEASTFIYDFGGGTFDVSIIKSDGEGGFEVCATAGNSKLGGEDLTNKIEEFIYDYLEDHYDLSMYSEEDSELSAEQFAYNVKTIYWAAESCKMELSASESTTMTLIDLYINDEDQKSVFIDMSRQEFETIIKPTINQTIAEMNNGLSKADMMISDVDNIILAGGTSLIPCIQDQVERYFGRKPSADKNAATLIAEGAAIIADAMFGENHLIKMQPQIFDMTYEDFGVALEKWNYSCIIPAGTTLPATAEKKYSLVEDYQSQLNIKVLSRKSEAQDAVKTYDQGVEYLDELIMTNIPPMKMDEVDVIVKFEITKQYELRTDVTLIKKDGTVVDKGNMSIDRQSTM